MPLIDPWEGNYSGRSRGYSQISSFTIEDMARIMETVVSRDQPVPLPIPPEYLLENNTMPQTLFQELEANETLPRPANFADESAIIPEDVIFVLPEDLGFQRLSRTNSMPFYNKGLEVDTSHLDPLFNYGQIINIAIKQAMTDNNPHNDNAGSFLFSTMGRYSVAGTIRNMNLPEETRVPLANKASAAIIEFVRNVPEYVFFKLAGHVFWKFNSANNGTKYFYFHNYENPSYYREVGYFHGSIPVVTHPETGVVLFQEDCQRINNYGWIPIAEFDANYDDYFECNDCGYYFRLEDRQYEDEDGDDYDSDICQDCHSRRVRDSRSSNRESPIGCYSNRQYPKSRGHQPLSAFNGAHGIKALEDIVGYIKAGQYDTTKEVYESSRRRYGQGHPVNPFRINDTARRFGVEVEVESTVNDRHDDARHVWEHISKFTLLKEDGSIENGFEIVSGPADLFSHVGGKLREYGKKKHNDKREAIVKAGMWKDFFSDLPKGLLSYKTDTCGMHIHISRNTLSKAQITKMCAFINDTKHAKFIRSIAGRGSVSYSHLNGGKKMKGWRDDLESFRHDRYRAVNICNEHTVELRLFRGTLKEYSFYRNIEFAASISEWTADCARSYGDVMNVEKYHDWVTGAKAKEYPYLAKFLLARWPKKRKDGEMLSKIYDLKTEPPTAIPLSDMHWDGPAYDEGESEDGDNDWDFDSDNN